MSKQETAGISTGGAREGGSDAERVVLLDDRHRAIGTALKSEVHTDDTALHYAFSCWVLDDDGRVLLTRRALGKRTWPGVWTNSFCGHPGPGEQLAEAVARRARRELGIEVTELVEVLPDFAYRAVDASGIVENEFCPVFTARLATAPQPRDDEVMDLAWLEPAALLTAAEAAPQLLSPWLAQELADPRLRAALGA